MSQFDYKSEEGVALAQRLREETDTPLLECRRALLMYDGDYAKARAYIESGDWLMGKLVTLRR